MLKLTLSHIHHHLVKLSFLGMRWYILVVRSIY